MDARVESLIREALKRRDRGSAYPGLLPTRKVTARRNGVTGCVAVTDRFEQKKEANRLAQ
jgi:hypothetical protein